MRGVFKLLAVLAAASIIAGCSGVSPRTPEEAVGVRALAQAQALVDQQFDLALSFMAPSYQSGPRAASFQGSYEGSAWWKRVELAWVRCDEPAGSGRCSARIWVYGNIPSAGRYQSQRGDDVPISWDQTWIFVDGNWYHYVN